MNQKEIDLINDHLLDYLRGIGRELIKAGDRWKCLCPLHEEKTPSFFIDQSKGKWLWKCFGECGCGGDLIGLHAALTGRDPRRDFWEIARELAEKFEIEFPSSEPKAKRQWRGRKNASKREQGRRKERHFQKLEEAARDQLDSILKKFRSSDWRAEFCEASRIRLDGNPLDDWRLFIDIMFPVDAILFVGEPWQSGPGKGNGHFRSAGDWLRFDAQPGNRISPSTFRPGTVSRSKRCVEEQLFLVLESDDLIGRKPTNEAEREANKVATAALFRWCIESLRMRLAAVIDTGNRSLHGWFKYPKDPRVVEELKAIAESLRLDPALFDNPAAPLRLPGSIHEKTKRTSQLLYLAS